MPIALLQLGEIIIIWDYNLSFLITNDLGVFRY